MIVRSRLQDYSATAVLLHRDREGELRESALHTTTRDSALVLPTARRNESEATTLSPREARHRFHVKQSSRRDDIFIVQRHDDRHDLVAVQAPC